MAQLTHPVEPFGEVNVHRSGNELAIKAAIFMVLYSRPNYGQLSRELFIRRKGRCCLLGMLGNFPMKGFL